MAACAITVGPRSLLWAKVVKIDMSGGTWEMVPWQNVRDIQRGQR